MAMTITMAAPMVMTLHRLSLAWTAILMEMPTIVISAHWPTPTTAITMGFVRTRMFALVRILLVILIMTAPVTTSI
ncbi:MAG: hypothetical protein HOI23_18625 [Deltaproteobacteria bacterium]|nr:hypothetical protein [Deltaproteobacteria bacterium]